MINPPQWRLKDTPTSNRVYPELGSDLAKELDEALEQQRWVYNEYKARKVAIRKAKQKLEYARIGVAKSPRNDEAYAKLRRANESILLHQLLLHKMRPALCRARAEVSFIKIKVRAKQKGYDKLFRV